MQAHYSEFFCSGNVSLLPYLLSHLFISLWTQIIQLIAPAFSF